MTRALPIVVAVVLAVYALIDCLQTDPADARGPRRGVWLAVIVLIPIIGPIAWLIAQHARTRPVRPRPQPPRPVAPDDNPEFLREIREVDDKHAQMLEQWEADLRRREEEMRHPPDGEND
ncbi:MAG: PLD nuclease N-terminal domain-containing protein [Jiangellaceae bacterium]